jgi:ABC-type phosphate transport system auxiliary subunit
MTPTLVVSIVGPMLGAFFGLSTFFVKRSVSKMDAQLNSIAENVEVISHQVTALQVSMPTNYVSKDDFRYHRGEEERWQQELIDQLNSIKDELSNVRTQTYHNPHHY